MDSTRRTSRSTLRRVAIMAALAALAPATAAEAAKKKTVKKPVITSVSPMNAEIGDVLTIRGRYFRKGRNRNTVVFKRDGAAAVFVRAEVATLKLIRVKIPASLEQYMANVGITKVGTRFRLRILAQRFGKNFTSTSKSPIIGPDKPPPPPPPPSAANADGDCDGDGVRNGLESDADNDGLRDDIELSLKLDPCTVDTDKDGLEDRWEFDCDRNGVLNRDQADDDSDLLDDALEGQLMTDPCAVDTDQDAVEDGYEYRSAVDLNDDDYESPNASMPYPGKRPYPNPLSADSNLDYDGDGLSSSEEQSLWKYTYEVTKTSTRTLATPLSYSAGEAYSVQDRHPDTGSRRPTLKADGYEKQVAFLQWAVDNGYRTVTLYDGLDTLGDPFERGDTGSYLLLDFNRDGEEWDGSDENPPILDGFYLTSEKYYYDFDNDGFLSDDERDEDADGLTNYDESHGRMTPEFWTACYGGEPKYPIGYTGTDIDDADSDGDGVRDGADDQDHDDIPNVMELSRVAASGLIDFLGLTCAPKEGLPKRPETHHLDAYGFVNPFNPCLPYTWSRTCERHPGINASFAPFTGPWWYSLH